MASATEMPAPGRRRPMSRRVRFIVAIVVSALVVLLLSLRGIAGFYTDYLWFDSLGYSSVWSGVLWAQVGLTVFFIVVMFVLLWVNLFIADRVAPSYRPPGPEEEFVRRYHETVGARNGLMRVGVAALFALFWGAGAGSRWQDWILFNNSVEFGIDDPQFGVDIGFYIFQLPFIQFLINWLFTAFVVTLIIASAAHYLNGGIRMNTPGERVTPQVKRHLSFLLAVLALIKAADYWYQRYSLNFSNRGVVDGASYTDVNAQLPAINLLILISLCAAVLLIVNIWRQGWVLPVVAVGLWAFVAIVMGGIYPAVYQRLRVEPNELEREATFIERNIEATRLAYGFAEFDDTGSLVGLPEEQFDFNPDDPNIEPLSPELLETNRDTLENVRLLDPNIVSPTFSRLEVERDQFRFAPDLDVDRYRINGEERVVVVAARELNLGGVRSGWENQHVSFTHGYGLAVAPANVVTDEGEPNFVVGGLPTLIDSDIDVGLSDDETLQPRIYIGEGLDGYAIVGTRRCEVDFPLTGGSTVDLEETVDVAVDPDAAATNCEQTQGRNQESAYEGNDGVRAGGFLRRAAFALRFQDLNPIFSGLINDDSKFIYNRDVLTRARELAPFLDFDADSYPAIIDGRIVFILDAYTTSNNYPYSQSANQRSVPSGSDLRSSFNYVRNSVKVVVDAYNGDVDFFVVDDSDPIIQAYQGAFPELFKTTDDPAFTDELVQHLRYPEDLFRVQTNMWATYQLDQAAAFFDDTAAWSVAIDPGSTLERPPVSESATGSAQLTTVSSGDLIDPHYVQMRLPGETDQEFLIMRPFVPSARSGDDFRQELTAFMAGRIDENGKQSLISYRVPGTAVDGPVLANSAMLNNTTVAQRTTLLSQQGSNVKLGNMLLVPMDTPEGDSRIIYVRPLYVDSGNLPLARLVIVSYDTTVRMCPTFGLALGALFVPESELDDECSGVVSPLTGQEIPTSDQPVDAVDTDPDPDPDPDPTPDPETDDADPEPESTPDPGEDPDPDAPAADVETLLQQAADTFDEADEALADGDLGRYQELVQEAEQLLAEALATLDS